MDNKTLNQNLSEAFHKMLYTSGFCVRITQEPGNVKYDLKKALLKY